MTHMQTSDAMNNAKHPLLIWPDLDSGNVVSCERLGNCDYVGAVDQKTNDELIIWIRDDLNEIELFHFRDCLSVA
jgi:hypothetical protein